MLKYLTPILCLILVGLNHELLSSDFSSPEVETISPLLNEAKAPNSLSLSNYSVKHPRIALVLSGGGTRGVAAIGVLRALEKNNIPIDIIIGTSIGSVIGGLYSMGYSPDQLKRIIDTTKWEEILSLSDEIRRSDMFLDQKITREKSVLVLRFKGLKPIIPEAFSTAHKLTKFLNVVTFNAIYKPVNSYDELRIPFRAVTTDLITGKRIVIDRGDMTQTLRASLAVPLLFSSVRRDTLMLLDGGLVDNLPVDVAIQEKADIIIAVDVVSPLRPRDKLSAPWEIADQITTIMMQETVKLSRQKADIVIKPKLGDRLPSDYFGLDSLIDLGESATEECMPRLKSLLQERTLRLFNNETKSSFSQEKIYNKPRFNVQGIISDAYQNRLKAYEIQGHLSRADLQKLVNDLYEVGDYSKIEGSIQSFKDSTIIQLNLALNPIISNINIQGNNIISIDTLIKPFEQLLNKPLNTKILTYAVERVINIYREAGYSLARVINMHFDSTMNSLNILLDEGVIFRTDVRGTSKTRDWVVRRELPWRSKDLLTSSQLEKGISNLYSTSLFDQVRLSVHYEGDSSKLNIITVNASERSTELIRFGLRMDNERNIQPSIDIRDENLLGAGVEIGLFVGGGTRNQSYIAELKAIRIFNTYLTFTIRGFSLVRDINFYSDVFKANSNNVTRSKIGEYREIRNGGLMSFGMQLERLGNIAVEGRLEKHQVLNIINSPITNDVYNISSLRFGMNLDTQDKVPYPREGEVINFYYESALVKILESVGFTKMYASYEKYASIGDHTFHPRLVLGVADETLPLSEHFSFGGQHNFFGYYENDIRGRYLTIASLEYQYKLPFSLFFDTYFKLRYDFGTILARTKEMRLDEFKHGIGATIGLDTPIGPAEFSIGRSFYVRKDLANRPISYSPFIIYFSIGYPITGVVRN